MIDRSQAWFWTKEWQAMEAEVDKDIKEGRIYRAENIEELIDNLEKD